VQPVASKRPAAGTLCRSLEIIDDQGPGSTAEVPEGIFETANEVVGGLTINCFTVSLARETQNNPEDMRSLTLAIGPDNRCAGAEVNLRLFAGHTFHPAKRYRSIISHAFDKSANTIVAAIKSILISEILIDSLTG